MKNIKHVRKIFAAKTEIKGDEFNINNLVSKDHI